MAKKTKKELEEEKRQVALAASGDNAEKDDDEDEDESEDEEDTDEYDDDDKDEEEEDDLPPGHARIVVKNEGLRGRSIQHADPVGIIAIPADGIMILPLAKVDYLITHFSKDFSIANSEGQPVDRTAIQANPKQLLDDLKKMSLEELVKLAEQSGINPSDYSAFAAQKGRMMMFLHKKLVG